ncbi:MAG: NAD-dependent epimerase/dehydratase family protein, partial [candidate division NC10 bacterium]
MSSGPCLVTGGAGFLGAALVRRLLSEGRKVRVLDNQFRGTITRLEDLRRDFEFIAGDIRDPETVRKAMRGMASVCHMAFINGTEFFYSRPALVLEVGVKGMLNVMDAALQDGVEDLVLVSSSEVYQAPPVIPTDETAPLSIPDPLNPRYSYAAGKIISEVMALHCGGDRLKRVAIVRPHNVYGPDMGWEHVIPQLSLRIRSLCREGNGALLVPVRGSGKETRSFVFIDDFIDGLRAVMERAGHREIY